MAHTHNGRKYRWKPVSWVRMCSYTRQQMQRHERKKKIDSNQNKNCTLRKAQLNDKRSHRLVEIFPNHISDKGLGYVIQNIYSEAEYIINSYKSIKQVIQFKNGQKTWTLISPKKTYKGLINTRKCAEHH